MAKRRGAVAHRVADHAEAEQHQRPGRRLRHRAIGPVDAGDRHAAAGRPRGRIAEMTERAAGADLGREVRHGAGRTVVIVIGRQVVRITDRAIGEEEVVRAPVQRSGGDAGRPDAPRIVHPRRDERTVAGEGDAVHEHADGAQVGDERARQIAVERSGRGDRARLSGVEAEPERLGKGERGRVRGRRGDGGEQRRQKQRLHIPVVPPMMMRGRLTGIGGHRVGRRPTPRAFPRRASGSPRPGRGRCGTWRRPDSVRSAAWRGCWRRPRRSAAR